MNATTRTGRLVALALLVLLVRSSPLTQIKRLGVPEFYHYRLPVVLKNWSGPEPEPQLKKGLAGVADYCADSVTLGANWVYDWSPQPRTCGDVASVPMLWCSSDVGRVASQSEWLLGFNEPDRPDQCNMAVEKVAPQLRTIENLYASYQLISPAPSHLAPGYLRQLRAVYAAQYGEYPKWSALAMHCYFGDDLSLNSCIALVNQYAADAREWGIGAVWVTEFSAVNANLDYAAQLERRFIEYLDRQPTVVRYAHFTNRWDTTWQPPCPECIKMRLIDERDLLTPLGEEYVKW